MLEPIKCCHRYLGVVGKQRLTMSCHCRWRFRFALIPCGHTFTALEGPSLALFTTTHICAILNQTIHPWEITTLWGLQQSTRNEFCAITWTANHVRLCLPSYTDTLEIHSLEAFHFTSPDKEEGSFLRGQREAVDCSGTLWATSIRAGRASSLVGQPLAPGQDRSSSSGQKSSGQGCSHSRSRLGTPLGRGGALRAELSWSCTLGQHWGPSVQLGWALPGAQKEQQRVRLTLLLNTNKLTKIPLGNKIKERIIPWWKNHWMTVICSPSREVKLVNLSYFNQDQVHLTNCFKSLLLRGLMTVSEIHLFCSKLPKKIKLDPPSFS